MDRGNNLHIPLPLAEMLHALLGPLGEQLAREGHSWAPFIARVLAAYTQGRDDYLANTHGPSVVAEVDLCTVGAADALCKWIAEIASEEEDFEMWAKEFMDETSGEGERDAVG